MKRSYIPAFVMLLAGTITCVVGLIYQYSVIRLLTTLLIVLLSFYVIGSIFKWLIDLLIPLKQEEEPEDTGTDGETEDEKEEEKEEEQKEDEDKKSVFKG